MSADPLPQLVNIRKAVTRSARYSGTVGAEQLPQFAAFLDPDGMPVRVTVEFGEDEEGQQFATVTMHADVILECQRCLQPVAKSLEGNSRLALVPDDERARHLSSAYEPWLAIDEVDLWELAGEELALALPVVAYHPEGECETPAGSRDTQDDIEKEEGISGGTKENPFNVLSALLDSDDAKEK